MAQLPLFEISIPRDEDALLRCSRAEIIALDVETETRWSGRGPKLEYGLSYPAEVTIMAFAWREGDAIQTTAIAAPFDAAVSELLKTLFTRQVIAHNAVFDMRQLSKYTDGMTPERIWDTMTMARLLHPLAETSYSLLNVAAMLDIPVSAQQAEMKTL